MGSMFDERERAAEGIFIRDEELRFLARRRGVEGLAAWAADSMAMDEDSKRGFSRRLVDLFLAGVPEHELVEIAQTDLERAGKPALSTNAATVLAQAIADATMTLKGRAPLAVASGEPRAMFEHPARPAHSWGWGL